jgi:hypothetical protein
MPQSWLVRIPRRRTAWMHVHGHGHTTGSVTVDMMLDAEGPLPTDGKATLLVVSFAPFNKVGIHSTWWE